MWLSAIVAALAIILLILNYLSYSGRIKINKKIIIIFLIFTVVLGIVMVYLEVCDLIKIFR